MRPKVYKELTVVDVVSVTTKMEQGPTGHRKDPHHLHEGKTAAGLLGQRLWVSGLVTGSIGHGEARAIDHLDGASSPETRVWDVSLHAIANMPVDALQENIWEPCPSLTLSTGIRRILDFVSQRPPCLGFAHCVAAGRIRRKHLREKGPKSHQWAEESLPAGAALWLRTKQGVGNQGAEGFTQSGDGIGPRKLTLELSASCPRSSHKKQGTKSIKKRGGRNH